MSDCFYLNVMIVRVPQLFVHASKKMGRWTSWIRWVCEVVLNKQVEW